MTLDDTIDELIAYVEGQLPPDRRAAFEARLAASPELRQQLQLVRQIDDSMLHEFAAPGFVKIDFDAARAAAAQRARPASVSQLKRWGSILGAAIAAAIVLTVVAFYGQNIRFDRTPMLTVSSWYDNKVATGFKPDWVCKDDAEFVKTTREAFGLPLLATSDANVQIVGWTGYGDKVTDLGVSPKARCILARVDGDPVMVIIDKAGAGQPPQFDRAARKKLHLFEKKIDDLILYEITPHDKPQVIEKFAIQRGA